MKFFAVFSCIVAVAMASTTWTIPELSDAIQNPTTDAMLLPYLESALNDLMLEVMLGNPTATTTVSSSVQDFSLWTLNELSEALQDESTDPALVPYLEHALNNMMSAIISGQQIEAVIVATPVGLLPAEIVIPIIPEPVDTGIVPAPVATEAVSSPLVQIIVNVKSQQTVSPGAVAEPAIVPEPVLVAPEPVIVPSPVVVVPIVPNPVDVIAITPPEAIVNPVDVISINPEAAINPIDVVAVVAPEINPVDIMNPVPVVAPVNVVDNGILV